MEYFTDWTNLEMKNWNSIDNVISEQFMMKWIQVKLIKQQNIEEGTYNWAEAMGE